MASSASTSTASKVRTARFALSTFTLLMALGVAWGVHLSGTGLGSSGAVAAVAGVFLAAVLWPSKSGH